MKLTAYIDLYQLLQEKHSSHENNRAFGLEHTKRSPVSQLLFWTEAHKNRLRKPLLSTKFSTYLYRTSLILGIVAFVLGLLSGIGLLQYNGHEPVNMVYFLAMVVVLPLLTMTLSLLSMWRANIAQNTLIHLSPAFWMEKIIGSLPSKAQQETSALHMNPLLLNWLVLKRAQMLALLFSIGLFLALLGVVSTKDIAFAWSTTLQVSTEAFQHFLSLVALPWRDLIPSAVPSIELVEQSQYFRLGEKLDSRMIASASMLGEWWKFLAMATLFYAIFLRALMWVLAGLGWRRALRSALLGLEGTDQLLYEMNTPLVTTTSAEPEKVFVQNGQSYGRVLSCKDPAYGIILGWAIETKEITLLNDGLKRRAEHCYTVGGSNSLAEDSHIVSQCEGGEVLLYVKAWEPPTMDLVDFLTELTQAVDRVVILPVGTVSQHYLAEPQAWRIWERKLQQMENKKVWLCQNS